MDIVLPSGCGNAPRTDVVGDFAVNWAAGEESAVAEWLTEDAAWTLVGADTYGGTDAAAMTGPPFKPERVELLSIITHGRLASCDGYFEAADQRIAFSHAFRFASTSKTAKIAEIRSYCIAL